MITHPDLKNQRYWFADQEGPPPSTPVLGQTAPFPAPASGCTALLKKDAKIPPPVTRHAREHLSCPDASAESSVTDAHTPPEGTDTKRGLFQQVAGGWGAWIPLTLALIHQLHPPSLSHCRLSHLTSVKTLKFKTRLT